MKSLVCLILVISTCSAQLRRRGGRQQSLAEYNEPLDQYGAESVNAGVRAGEGDELAALESSIPGIPGEDYPIYAQVPETAFLCDGQVDGGKV